MDSNEQEGRWSYSDKRDVERTLNGIKEALYTCEAVVIMRHSHEITADQEYEADYFMEELAHVCIDAGACAVVGSGTHQMKGIEFYKDCPIFYCLGNFIFENEFVRDLPADYMEKYGLPVPQPKITTRPFSRWRSARPRTYGSAMACMVIAV